MRKYSKKNGWYVDWTDLLDDNEIYALVVEGTVDIQGLVALKPVKDFGAVLVSWMVSAPHNNKQLLEDEKPKYLGVGVVKHYCDVFDADFLGILHPYQIMIGEEASARIMEVYDYEWTDDEL